MPFFVSQKVLDTYINKIEFLENEVNRLSLSTNREIKYPKRLGNITFTELLKLLQQYKCGEIYLSDNLYGVTSVDEARFYSQMTPVEARKYVSEKYDCDEFSFALMGYWNECLEQFAFGIAWSKTHAFNIFVDDAKRLWVVEPQTNVFHRIEDVIKDESYYPFRFVLV